MVNRIIVPTLLVAAMWIVVSLTTTAYVLWLDASYHQDFELHVRCTESAGSLMEHVWHLQADFADHETAVKQRQVINESVFSQLQEDVVRLTETPGSPEHGRLIQEMKRIAVQYEEVWQRRTIAPESPSDRRLRQQIAEQLADHARLLRELHHEQLRESAASRLAVSKVIFWIRGITLLIGPLLGWWMARRLGRVVNEIRVTLETHAALSHDQLGAIQFRAGDDLALIQRQVELVVHRLRATAEELEHAHQEVFRSDRLAAVGRLAAGVAHELRNPLTSVKLLMQYADQPGNAALTEQQRQLILEEIERMEHTIQGLLDLSRAAPIQRMRHDLRETLSRAVQLISGRAARQRTDIHVSTGRKPLWIDGDAPQLHQVFVNLFLNSLESVFEGGSVRVHAKALTAPPRICIEFQDSGPGIPDDVLPCLFEPFVTTKEQGTGLGLAISQRIIESHGGTIHATNAPQGGAVFLIELPQTASMIQSLPDEHGVKSETFQPPKEIVHVRRAGH